LKIAAGPSGGAAYAEVKSRFIADVLGA